MSDERAYKGACFCGAVQLTVTGEPVGMGLLPLRFVQALVGRARQRLHAMEARGGTRYARRRQHRHLQQDAAQLSQMVQVLRRASLHRAPRHETHRCEQQPFRRQHAGAAERVPRNRDREKVTMNYR